MQVNIDMDEKRQVSMLEFELENFKSPHEYKVALGLIFAVCGDFSLDPEFELEDLQKIVNEALNDLKNKSLLFEVSEEGLELEIIKKQE